MQISVHDLKNNLSKYLHRVKTGEIVVVTSHRVPIAKITAIVSPPNSKLQAVLALEGVRWNGKKPQGNDTPPEILGKTAAEYILEDRG